MKGDMNSIALVVHGGAGPDSKFIREHQQEYKEGLTAAVEAGYKILERGGTAMDAVEAAVCSLEDNPIFNAGRGSVLNAEGAVEMCASIMQGSDQRTGACSLVVNVQNPVKLARAILENNKYNFIGGPQTSELAKEYNLPTPSDDYFITPHQQQLYQEEMQKQDASRTVQSHGTVGAVACDCNGNLAAATSTGSTEMKIPGRISDSAVIGAGVYANNSTCAISCSGDGEYITRFTVAHDIAACIEYQGDTLEEAMNYVLKEKLAGTAAEIGAIGVNTLGEISISFNAERMHRAWRTFEGKEGVAIYRSKSSM
jgi:L-asparaginase / beta-aspartyl-peptidase